ncbi:MAG TPA: winged helix-turn-helix domain-containing protein [Terriglobales bacterium]|nr:winged helix-turn-helix domain-containing protein [Terriglobales bacterium]
MRTRQLTRNGAKVRLAQQPIQVLCLLLENPGEVVTRDEFRRRLWPSDVFVDFDHGLNKSIQKLRDALRDSASSPRYIETVPRIGYRFIAPLNAAIAVVEPASQPEATQQENRPASPEVANRQRRRFWRAAFAIGACLLLAFGAIAMYRSRQPSEVRYTQITDFTDSAVEPVISPDGRMLAFIRGGRGFLTPDQIYVKMLPNGEARKVTDDSRPKYGPAFSPDGSQIAYTVLDRSGFSTYEVSALGGEPHLLFENAAGLTWLDAQHLLFSLIRPGEGIHLGVVTATVSRGGRREIYFPAHKRGMAHYSIASPDRRWALIVEMNGNGAWAQCRLVGLEGQVSPGLIGPAGACTSAGWSPDGRWMYFTALVEGQSHIWRQRFPEGEPDQITFGPLEESGLAMEPDGRALITSVGAHESAVWIHDGSNERSLSSEGEVISGFSDPAFSPDGSALYYLLRRGEGQSAELWCTVTSSSKSESLFPGVSVSAFDVSPDGKQVVYTTPSLDGSTQLWIAALDRRSAPAKLQVSGAHRPHFGQHGRILFQSAEGDANYLEQVDADGSHRTKVLPYPIVDFQSLSPDRRWLVAVVPNDTEKKLPSVMAISLDGGASHRLCQGYCDPKWSTDGAFLVIAVEDQSDTSPGRSLAIPVGPDESFANFPPSGIAPAAEASEVTGARSIERAPLIPGKNPDHYAWVNTTAHRNLYRVTLP